MHEIELKLQLTDPALLERLATSAQFGDLQVLNAATAEQCDEYWDTPDGSAAKGGISLRQRTSAKGAKFTLKTGRVEAGISRRVEIEQPAKGRTLTEWLTEILATGEAALPFSPNQLAPRLSIRNQRTTLNLGPVSEATVELVLDRVTYHGPRGEAQGYEIEAELLSGDEAQLERLGEWLQAQGEMQPSSESKYERAVRLVG